jgi:hypothetical protein
MAANKQKYYDAYFKNFSELLDNLEIIRPNDMSLMAFKGYMNIYVSTYGLNSLVQHMNLYIKNYKDKIMKQDETFFINELTKDFKDDSFIVNEIKKIQEIWIDPATTDKSKDIIWRYFKVFSQLSSKIQ